MIDDETSYLEDYQELLDQTVQFWGATRLRQGIDLIKKYQPEVLLLDITLSTDDEGLEILPQLKARFPELAVIMVSNRDSLLTSRKATEYGAVDYFVKSENIQRLRELITLYALEPPRYSGSNEQPIAVSRVMRRVIKQARLFAKSDAAVLLTGETGVGKDVIAKFTHQQSGRSTQPFLMLNCGGMERNLLISELFGHVKGAFTGAMQPRAGKFEAAQGGTLFLNEIGEMPLQDQTVLLHVLEAKEVTRIGSNIPVSVDVRVIAATNQPLAEYIAAGKFRQDLYYRLSALNMHLPPLREREADILPLAKHFLQQAIRRNGTSPKNLGYSALLALKSYHWPGNVRELQNVIERAAITFPGREISGNHLSFSDPPEINATDYRTAKSDFQRRFLKDAVVKHHGNISATARAVGMSRQGLQKRLRELGLDLKDESEKGEERRKRREKT